MIADIFTIFGGIFSSLVTFLGFILLIILFTSSIFTAGISNLIAGESTWFLMFIMLL